MEEKFVDIILPAYNASKYLGTAIKSVLKQSYVNWNLIIVNDGSTDNSLDICYKFAKKDNRIKVINQSNCGSLMARLNGVKAGNGEYVTFLDADDILLPNALQELCELMVEYDAEIVASKYRTLSKHGLIKSYKTSNITIKEMNSIDSLTDFFTCQSIGATVWAKLYKRELWMSCFDELMRLPRIFNGEDFMLNVVLLKNINKLIFVTEAYYLYRVNGGSSKLSDKALKELVVFYEWRKNFLLHNLDLKLNIYNLNQILNIVIYWYHFEKMEFSLKNIKEELRPVISDIPVYGNNYYYSDVYLNIDNYSCAKFRKLYKEPFMLKLKSCIAKVL